MSQRIFIKSQKENQKSYKVTVSVGNPWFITKHVERLSTLSLHWIKRYKETPYNTKLRWHHDTVIKGSKIARNSEFIKWDQLLGHKVERNIFDLMNSNTERRSLVLGPNPFWMTITHQNSTLFYNLMSHERENLNYTPKERLQIFCESKYSREKSLLGSTTNKTWEKKKF